MSKQVYIRLLLVAFHFWDLCSQRKIKKAIAEVPEESVKLVKLLGMKIVAETPRGYLMEKVLWDS